MFVNLRQNRGNQNQMAEPLTFQEQQETTSTVTVVETDEQDVPRVTLKLRKPKTDRKVQWSTETVDNENMNKKKSKCCCIFEKPRKFGESSSDSSEDECEHCQGHVEKKKKYHKRPSTTDSVDGGGTSTMHAEPSQTITLEN